MRISKPHKESAMQSSFFDRVAPKKSTNLAINSNLLRQAEEHHINLSQTLELRLAELLREEKSRKWQEENGEACSAFSVGLRRF